MTAIGGVLAKARARNTLLDYLFPAQRAAVLDASTYKAFWTTRRAGKTTSALVDFAHDAGQPGHADYKYIYIGLTNWSAEEIAWGSLKQLDRQHNLGIDFQEVKLRAKLPNGAYMRLYGADRPGWMHRLYGQKLRKVYIDEAAFYTIDLEALIADILRPAVADLRGQIVLMSIPGHHPSGLFHDVISGFGSRRDLRGEVSPSKPGWSVHSWTTADNPSMARQFADAMAEEIAHNPAVVNDPKFRRNYLGETVLDRGERVYDFRDELNTHPGPWEVRPGDHYVLGLDFGWHDAQAFSVVGWRDDSPELVEVESHRETEMRMDKIASYVSHYMECYPDLEIVGDPHHRQYFEEFRRRYDLPVMEAEKSEKLDWIEIINADYANGLVKVVDPANSPHVAEMRQLSWRTKPDGRRFERPGQDNHCCDAFLYAYRHAYHYRYEPQEAQPDRGTDDWWRREEDRWTEQLEERLQPKGDDSWT